MLKTQKALDRRDRKLLVNIWRAALEALDAAAQGHNHKWEPLRKALDKAEDEMGPLEDYEATK